MCANNIHEIPCPFWSLGMMWHKVWNWPLGNSYTAHPELSSYTCNEIRVQESGNGTAKFVWGKQRRHGFLDGSLVLFWTLVETFNSAAVPTYLGLSALWHLIFLFPPTWNTKTEFQEMKGIEERKHLSHHRWQPGWWETAHISSASSPNASCNS